MTRSLISWKQVVVLPIVAVIFFGNIVIASAIGFCSIQDQREREKFLAPNIALDTPKSLSEIMNEVYGCEFYMTKKQLALPLQPSDLSSLKRQLKVLGISNLRHSSLSKGDSVVYINEPGWDALTWGESLPIGKPGPSNSVETVSKGLILTPTGRIEVEISSIPKGAHIFDSDDELGDTTLHMLSTLVGLSNLVFKMDGYEDCKAGDFHYEPGAISCRMTPLRR